MRAPFFNASEKRILSGNLPTKELYPVAYSKPTMYFLLSDYSQALDNLPYYEEFLPVILSTAKLSAEKIEGLDAVLEDLLYDNSWNWNKHLFTLINTQYHPRDLADETYQTSAKICPYITPFDKLLTGVCSFLMQGIIGLRFEGHADSEQAKDAHGMLRDFLTILRTVQLYEMYSTCTVDVASIDQSFSLHKTLVSWKAKIDSVFSSSGLYYDSYINWTQKSKNMVLLSDHERKGIIQLERERIGFLRSIRNEQHHLSEIAEKTTSDWELFLQLVHDISKREENIIHTILDQKSTATEKLQIIEEYEKEVFDHRNGTAIILEKPESLERIISSVEKRLALYPLSQVYECDGQEFSLDPAILSIAKRREDYNYFLIKYHHFRLCPYNPELAAEFMRLSLSIINRNLLQKGGTTEDGSSLLEIISAFYDVVLNFFNSNKEIIESLTFAHIQETGVDFNESTLVRLSYWSWLNNSFEKSESFRDPFDRTVSELQAKVESKEIKLEDVSTFLSTSIADYLHQMLNKGEKDEDGYQKRKKETKARQIVVSLDIIFLFCDVLRIILQSPERYGINSEIAQEINLYYRRLSRLEDDTSHKVYSSIPWDEQNLHEARQVKGVDSKNLIEQEQNEERLRNETFKNAYNDEIKQLLMQIERGGIHEAFNAKSVAQEKLSRLPDCSYKEQALEVFDSVSKEICEMLIKKERQNAETFSARKQLILTQLGEIGHRLPAASVDSLATAEFLFHKYVSIEYAEKSFDYSCISCLYYQAFEEAYNALVWRDYAEWLNNLVVDGCEFIKILRKEDKFAVRDYFFYKRQDWKNYYDFSLERLSNSCMFGPFVKLLKQITDQKELVIFRDYFAQTFCFANDNEMQKNEAFMEKLKHFISSIENCNDKRNKASHGGKRIGVEQCKEDKRIVVNNIESVREDSIGLIQQLLFLLDWKNQDFSS